MARSQKQLIYPNLEITGLASEGMGVARHEGIVVFVEHTVTGDVVDVQITRKKSGFRQGKPIHFHTFSPLRIDPVCEHFGTCGGCKWQNISYENQLIHKQKTVTDALTRIAKVELPEISPILGAPEPFYYRNKMEYTFSSARWLTEAEINSEEKLDNRNALGFHIPGRFDKVLDIRTCHLQDETGNKIRLFVKKYAEDRQLQFYDIIRQTGLLRNLMIRNTIAGEWMVILSVTEMNTDISGLLDGLGETFPQITSLLYTINTKKNDVMYDLDIITWKGNAFITEEMEGLEFRIGPKSFYQTNPKQAYELYKKTREFAGIEKEDIVYDLYTGTGTIALFVAANAKKVVGIESVPEAIEDAFNNAALNGISNIAFTAGDMKDVLVDDFFALHGKPDIIITDPPRVGMHADVTKRLLESGAKKIVYVSCNPSTQARDIALLDEKYKVTKVQPVDMFPQTTHVENIVLMEKRLF